MKVVMLLAGMGKRLGSLTSKTHKSLLPIEGQPLLGHLLDKLIVAGASEIIPIVGYEKEKVSEFIREKVPSNVKIKFYINDRYQETNNLYSLFCAREYLLDKDFVVCNGDLATTQAVFSGILNEKASSAIALDDSKSEVIDSPGTILKGQRVYDLGRHIPFDESGGYAIGIYKFGQELSYVFFDQAEKWLKRDLQSGYHDPMRDLFASVPIYKHSIKGEPWRDLDIVEDFPVIEGILKSE